ncbi:hypothetical protein V491_01528 [Pseudogymnoascus sp. VKM F-3775]|nr:hypothetical protein V491_01528 [Pseudogymnoascus sp. VKM F-3775]
MGLDGPSCLAAPNRSAASYVPVGPNNHAAPNGGSDIAASALCSRMAMPKNLTNELDSAQFGIFGLRIREYFEAFATGNHDEMNNMVADEYRMSDISIGIVRSPKETWHQQNKGFSGLMTDISVEAISLHGSSEPGSFAIMENVIRFTLKADPPEEVKANLPPGIKKGDSTGMMMLSAIWWDGNKKVVRELEYGRLLWPNFDINAFNTW